MVAVDPTVFAFSGVVDASWFTVADWADLELFGLVWVVVWHVGVLQTATGMAIAGANLSLMVDRT